MELNRFHINCLRRLLRITWKGMILDTEVLKRAGLQSIHALLKKAQFQWADHVVRMSNERLPKRLLNCQRGGDLLAVSAKVIKTPSNLP